jgi:hypothetical protein
MGGVVVMLNKAIPGAPIRAAEWNEILKRLGLPLVGSGVVNTPAGQAFRPRTRQAVPVPLRARVTGYAEDNTQFVVRLLTRADIVAGPEFVVYARTQPEGLPLTACSPLYLVGDTLRVVRATDRLLIDDEPVMVRGWWATDVFSVGSLDWMERVYVLQIGGTAGDQSSTCTFTYMLWRMDQNPLVDTPFAAFVTPITPRRQEFGAYEKAPDYSLALYLYNPRDDEWELRDVRERPATEGCDC